MMMMTVRTVLLAFFTAFVSVSGQGCLTTNTCPVGGTEGPVLTISPMAVGDTNLGETGVTMTVMSVTVYIPNSSFVAGTIVSGAGVVLTAAMMLNPAPLPGRPNLAGFLGATAKCEVTDIDVDGGVTGRIGAMIGRSCTIEAAENVMLALVTNKIAATPAGNCRLFIGDNDLELVPNLDPRYAFTSAVDTEGFEIDYCSIPIGATVGGEGYYGIGETPTNRFHIFTVESSAGDRLGAPAGLTTISRARCANGGTLLEVRGTVTNPAVVRVVVTRTATGAVIGTATVAAFDPLTNTAGFRLRVNIAGGCPAAVTATADDGSAVTAPTA